MYSDMVNEFRNKGHNVLPMAPIISESSKTGISLENDIEVLRIMTLDVFSKNIFEKGFANLLLSFQYKKAYNLFWKEKPLDIVVIPTPSVMFADFINYVKKIKIAKVYLMQKDIFPQNAVDLGLMNEKSPIFKFFKKNEIKLLETADIIGCTSPGNVQYFLNHYPSLNKDKIKLLYNNTKLFDSLTNASSTLNPDLKGKFMVVFGGNMGRPQQVENVLNLAKRCVEYKDVIFLIIGKGTEMENLKRLAKNASTPNLKFIESLPREEYFNLLSNCNIGLISLHQDFSVPNTPMKLNDYLNAKIPVLASIDRNNDLGRLLVENKMGCYAFADSPNELLRQFLILYNDNELRADLGENGYDFCLKNLSVEKACKDIFQHLNSISHV